jgi:hypothetical protein
MDFDTLSTTLWKERELLELLLYKAEFKQYIIVTGKSQWLPRVAREIDLILEQMRAMEVHRAATSEALADALGLDVNPSLSALADAAPSPWNSLLRDHYEALLRLVGDLKALQDSNRALAENGLQAISDAIAATQEPSAGTYTAEGRRSSSTPRAVTLDGTL